MNRIFNFDEHIAKYASNTFINCGEQKTTFKKFCSQVKSAAQKLNLTGVKEQDVVALIGISPELFPVLLFAIWLNKAIALAVNPKFPIPQIQKVINESNARFYIAGKTSLLKSYSAISLSPVELFTPKTKIESVKNSALDLENPATVLLTSGSSGEPKYAVHSLGNHFYGAQAVNKYFNFSKYDSWLLTLPIFHIAGLAIIFRTFLAGSTLHVPKHGEKPSDSIQRYSPTHISLVPTQLQRVLQDEGDKRAIQKCKAVFLGGSAIPKTLIEKSLQNDLKLFTSYGLTEMGSTVAIKKIKDNTVGHAEVLSIHKIKISDDDEILLKGTCLFKGYLRKGEITNAYDESGWFHSKDLGELDELQRITVWGRKDNMFISGGENIYPEEIEKYLMEIDGVEQAIVVPVEDKEFGYRPVAFIQSNQKETTRKIKKYLGQYLPSFKIPIEFYPWPDESFDELKIDRAWFKNYVKVP